MQLENTANAAVLNPFFARAALHISDLGELPFVLIASEVLESARPINRDDIYFWNPPIEAVPQASEYWRGGFYASLVIVTARRLNWPELIGAVMGDIVTSGRMGQLEAGFVNRVCSLAYVGQFQ